LTSKTEQFYIRRIIELEKQVAELVKVNAELTDRITKLSKNSSKPPSSDIVKPPRKTKSKKPRNIGGQPGHTKHERMPFTTDEIDAFHPHTLDACPDCGGKLKEVENAGKDCLMRCVICSAFFTRPKN
jgi:transposase